ncbi:hypothetical protein [Psychrobium sp. 1_MG-2023]|uniref:hypothetical protein n=1 Tax=Psychrobium sp. 1_MG-2023 TaxID=3062624 RepID=UPI000C3431E2|nr:hypothetical protein [Psychrobium sp. 1_MG-2023]MDP2561726.1 hypothetical protein [Psychrobium sp. 1_MG-2023]PKF57125.1 hypothetical protein CW748_08560 [Alteromonadales bacterium alter-6D02]
MDFFFVAKFEIFLILLLITPVLAQLEFIRQKSLKFINTPSCSPTMTSVALGIIFIFFQTPSLPVFVINIFAFGLFFIHYIAAMSAITVQAKSKAKHK